jgi:cellulose synthase/poly-beta-1,6-N-acetylglucosamine synthase-like glycosyltransferase
VTVLVVAALGVVVYTYVGYPVLVAVLARLFPLRPGRDPSYEPTVTACVPLHNARDSVDAKLDSLLALDWPAGKLHILVYSDGCTDGGDALVQKRAATEPRIRLLRSETRLGKPSALNRMREEAQGEVLLMTDIRQPLEPGTLRALCAMLAPAEVGCVSGNLVLPSAQGAGAYWRYEKWIRRSEARFRGLCGVSGAIYALRRTDLAALPPDILLDDMWVPMVLRCAGRRILFCDEAVAWDREFEDGREFARRVRTLAGNFQLFARMPRLLVPFANRSWFETVSHKVLRLLCPFALLLLLAASLAVAARPAVGASAPAIWLVRGLCAAQLATCALAACGQAAGRLGSIARTFVLFNAAAVLGLWRYLRGAQQVTW